MHMKDIILCMKSGVWTHFAVMSIVIVFLRTMSSNVSGVKMLYHMKYMKYVMF